ncbi:ABC transporter ATP-binding protein [Planctomycetota bacterium]
MTESTSSTPSSKPVALLEHVVKSYHMGKGNDLQVLKDVNLTVNQRECMALMGPSGAGKSSLLNILGLLDTPTTGEYQLDGQDTATLSDRRLSWLRNHRIGFIFQAFNLFPRLSVQANIEVPMVYAEYSRRKRRERARELASHVGLGERLKHHPNQLSGGEMQRVAIARALACEPALVLADEPTGNLDEHTSAEIMGLLARLNSEGITIIMVTHNPELLEYVHRVVEIHDGQIREDRAI